MRVAPRCCPPLWPPAFSLGFPMKRIFTFSAHGMRVVSRCGLPRFLLISLLYIVALSLTVCAWPPAVASRCGLPRFLSISLLCICLSFLFVLIAFYCFVTAF